MSNSKWTTLSLVLISGSLLASSLASRSLVGAIVCLSVNVFAAGISFRGMVDGRRRAREKADTLFDDLAEIREDS